MCTNVNSASSMMVSIRYIDHKNCWIQSIKTEHLPTKRGIISRFAIPRDLKGAVDLNAVLSTVSFLDGLSLLDCLDLELFLLMVIDDFSFFNFPLFEELFCFITFSFFLLFPSFSDSLIAITEVSSNHTETCCSYIGISFSKQSSEVEFKLCKINPSGLK